MEKTTTTPTEDFNEDVLFGPIPYDVERVSQEEIRENETLLRESYPGFEIIKCFDEKDCVNANLLSGFAIVPLEMPYVPDVTFWILKSKRDAEDLMKNHVALPCGLVDCFASVGVDVDVDDSKSYKPILVCYNRMFKSVEVIRSVNWQELLLVILFCSVKETLVDEGETV